MAQAPRGRSRAAGPAGWVVLLGLMILALIIAAASKGCGGSDGTTPASQSPSPTGTGTTATGAGAGVAVIDQINARIRQSGGVPFVTGKADLTAASRTTLDAVAGILSRNPAVRAEVRGYTDDQGEAQKNLELSQRRAQAVVDYLVQKGVQAARLTARGLGEAAPLVPNDSEANRAKNRRVEFAIAP